MRALATAVALVTLYVASGGAAPDKGATDAARVLAAMRQALGGDARLDAVQSFSASGTMRQRLEGRTKLLSVELLAVLPDHFLEIRRDRQMTGPLEINITYYRGLRGDSFFRRTDSNIPFPPEPQPADPQAAAEHERLMTLEVRRELARLGLVLFGRTLSSYPMDFSYAGPGQYDGQSVEMVDVRAADGFAMRLAVDAATSLPLLVSWMGPHEAIMTTTMTSAVTMRQGKVVDESPATPAAPLPSLPPSGGSGTPRTLVLSQHKPDGGILWPRRLKESSPQMESELNISRYRANAKIDLRRFDIR